LSEIIKMAKVALFQLLTSFLVALFYSLPRIKRSAHAFYFSSSEAYESLARLFPSRLFSFFLYLHINIIFLIFSHPSIPQWDWGIERTVVQWHDDDDGNWCNMMTSSSGVRKNGDTDREHINSLYADATIRFAAAV
jgi:hypothetical protein